MSLDKDEHFNRLLIELKVGSILTKRKCNGEKYSRHFFLDEYEGFISYHQSEKIFAQSHRCKYDRIYFSCKSPKYTYILLLTKIKKTVLKKSSSYTIFRCF